jgi:antibiotic biosynthesis monooxygenase (ABM) superfamily enzyme
MKNLSINTVINVISFFEIWLVLILVSCVAFTYFIAPDFNTIMNTYNISFGKIHT